MSTNPPPTHAVDATPDAQPGAEPGAEPGDGVYLVGVLTADITPPVGTPLCGFAARGVHASTGCYHGLRCVAVAIDDGATPVLVLSAEWLGFYERAGRLRAAISAATGLSPDRIVVSGTHTHCGPALRARDVAVHGWVDEDYLRRAEDTMVAAAERAWRHRYPARLAYASARCTFAMNRRRPDPTAPGRVLPTPTPNPNGIVDHDVPVITIRSLADGVVRGIVFSYACHPTSRAGLLIGGDYVSFAYDHLGEAFPHAQPVFLPGCAGDQKPRPVRPDDPRFTPRTVPEVQELGEELGRAVEASIRADRLTPVTGPIGVRQTVLDLEIEPVGEPTPPVPFELQAVRFGDSLAVITMAGEPTVEHGLRLKRELGDRFAGVVPLGYANEIVGYVPVRRQFDELGYEVLEANRMYGRAGRLAVDTEDRIHAAIHQLLG